jgi:hypothetical protein
MGGKHEPTGYGMSWESPSIFTPRVRRLAQTSDGLTTVTHDVIFRELLEATRAEVAGTPMGLVVFGQGNQFRVVLEDCYVNVKQCTRTGGLVMAIRTGEDAIVTDPGPIWERDVSRWAASLATYIVHFLSG